MCKRQNNRRCNGICKKIGLMGDKRLMLLAEHRQGSMDLELAEFRLLDLCYVNHSVVLRSTVFRHHLVFL